jgi:hypothetical protein
MIVDNDDPELKLVPDNSPSPSGLAPWSLEWFAAYRNAIYQCKLRYKQMIYQNIGPMGGAKKLLDFLDEFTEEVPLMKISRWIGYIQGDLIKRGITTVEAERDWTRPLFRPLDFPNDETEYRGGKYAGVPEHLQRGFEPK